jgi:hypothetical protein
MLAADSRRHSFLVRICKNPDFSIRACARILANFAKFAMVALQLLQE